MYVALNVNLHVRQDLKNMREKQKKRSIWKKYFLSLKNLFFFFILFSFFHFVCPVFVENRNVFQKQTNHRLSISTNYFFSFLDQPNYYFLYFGILVPIGTFIPMKIICVL